MRDKQIASRRLTAAAGDERRVRISMNRDDDERRLRLGGTEKFTLARCCLTFRRRERRLTRAALDGRGEECRSAARYGSSKILNKKDPQLPQSPYWLTEGFWIGFRVVSPVKEPTEQEKLRYWNGPGIPIVLAAFIIGLSALGRILVVPHTETRDTIRIISARSATSGERRFYEEDESSSR